MDKITNEYSLPGDWVGGDGRLITKPLVNRILVLKADHIGDLLIADSAFALLRHFFPLARIELVCGTWNVALAKTLGRFDAVHGLNIFHEISGKQSEISVALAARYAAAQSFRDLQLGYFDLAIDLRYDLDTRAFLRNVDAGLYAGFGSAPEFPFLDIIVPRHGGPVVDAPTRWSIPGNRFLPRLTDVQEFTPNVHGDGDLSPRRSLLALGLQITGAASPRSCGTSPDDRLLGIGIERISITPLDADAKPNSQPFDVKPVWGSGWDSPEAWGTWTVSHRAQLSLAVPRGTNIEGYEVEISMRAHVNSANPKVICSISADGTPNETTIVFEHPIDSTLVRLTLPASTRSRALISPPFELSIGKYECNVRINAARAIAGDAHLELVLRATDGNVELLRHAIQLKKASRGLLSFAFCAFTDVSNGKLTFEVETSDSLMMDGARLHQVDFSLLEAQKRTLPISHMEDWASLLVLRVAQVLSSELPFGKSSPHRISILGALPDGTALPERLGSIVEGIAEWKKCKDIVVGVALGCNSEIRKWPLPYFVDLIDRILAIGNTRVVFIGSPSDQDEAAEACQQLNIDPAAYSFCGAVKLEMLGGLLSQLDFFIGSNTGTTHFAGKVGVRTIGIYAGTNHPREWGPIGDHATWIFRNEPCAPCHLTLLKDCHMGHRCIVDLLPQDVLEIVRPELESAISRRSRANLNGNDAN